MAGHDRKRDAQSALAAIVADSNARGSYLEPSRQKLADYLASTWLPGIESTVRPTTWTTYELLLRTHVIPRLGGIALRDLQPGDLNALYAALLQKLSPSSVSLVAVILGRSLKDAVRWGLLPRSVAQLSDPPRARGPEMKVWSAEQMSRFLRAMQGDRLHPLYTVACTCGLRRGELLGLRWADIDFDNARLSVRQTVVVNGSRIEFGRPKTARSVRSIALDGRTVSMLRTWRKTQLAERLAWGSGYHDQLDLVFCKEDGSVLHPQVITKRFAADAQRAGLPPLKLHGLRHSHASAALAAGVHPKTVAERLGHTSIAVTLDLYSHLLPSLEEEAADRIAGLIFG